MTLDDHINGFRAAMSEAGLVYSGKIEADGKLHRFNCDGEKREASGYRLWCEDSKYANGVFWCHRRGISQKWQSSNGSQLTPEEWRQIRQRQAEAEAERKSEEQKLRTDARNRAQRLLSAATPASNHPYLEAKGVSAYGEIRVLEHWPDQPALQGCLLLPVRDTDGSLHTLELIAADKRFGDAANRRNKQFLYGGDPKGRFYTISDTETGPLVICEGYATGASIHAATNWATICALSSTNLAPTALAARKKWPSRTIIVAADNDRFTSINGEPHNSGLVEAHKAAKASNAIVVHPEFSDEDAASTDFNDLAQTAGLETIKKLFLAKTKASEDWTLWLEDAAESICADIPEPTQIVDGMICEHSKVVVGGGSKTNKTWFLMNLAVGFVTRKQFLSRDCLPRRVLYVNLELRPNTFKRRLKKICSHLEAKIEPTCFMELHLAGRLGELSARQVIDKIIAAGRSFQAQVVFLDPIYLLNTEGDENSSRDQTILFRQIDRITVELPATLIIADHFGKGNQSEKDPLDAIRGSSAKGGFVDAALILRAHEEENAFRLDVVHRELPPIPPFVVEFEFPIFKTAHHFDPSNMKKGGRPTSLDLSTVFTKEILKRDSNNPISASEWSELTGIPRTTLNEYWDKFRSKGWIKTVGAGSQAKKVILPAAVAFFSKSGSALI